MLIMIATAFSVCGAIAVAFNRAYIANVVWLISNPLLIYHNYTLGEFEQAAMFTVFALIAIFGTIRGVRKHEID